MIEISMETVAPGGLDVEGAIGRAGQFALEQEGQGDAWLSVQVVDDEAIRVLNRDFRALDRPTDVLSFPMEEGAQIAAIPDGFLGDIVISLDKALAQAMEYGHSPVRELSSAVRRLILVARPVSKLTSMVSLRLRFTRAASARLRA